MIKSLNELFELISSKLRKGTKLSNLEEIVSLYEGDDWNKYKNLSKECYKRTFVCKDDLVEIIIIGWDVNQKSPIHDHPKNGCLVKILEGELIETTYSNTLEEINSTKLSNNGLSYQESNKILHKIENKSSKPVYSLHIYAPPNYKPNYYTKGCRGEN